MLTSTVPDALGALGRDAVDGLNSIDVCDGHIAWTETDIVTVFLVDLLDFDEVADLWCSDGDIVEVRDACHEGTWVVPKAMEEGTIDDDARDESSKVDLEQTEDIREGMAQRGHAARFAKSK